jgi:hypothetical protein
MAGANRWPWGSPNIANDASKLKWLTIFTRETNRAILQRGLDILEPTS